jgi:Cu/Ag efflux protein CusF
MQRRHIITTALALLAAASSATVLAQARTQPLVRVWKDPNCGCCNDWITYLKANGFDVQSFDTGNSVARQRLGMPNALASCHTAQVGGYVIEGHVPAADIHRLLREQPKALGLSVPGMPIGSPGMDGPEYGDRRDPYDVLLVQRDGRSSVWSSYFKTSASSQGGMQKVSDNANASDGRPWAEAEVRRINTRNQTVSLRHGNIANLDMPPMTMVFKLQDPSVLEGLKAGDRVRFTADQVRGDYTVMLLERLP